MRNIVSFMELKVNTKVLDIIYGYIQAYKWTEGNFGMISTNLVVGSGCVCICVCVCVCV
jgi:hypothetical protein